MLVDIAMQFWEDTINGLKVIWLASELCIFKQYDTEGAKSFTLLLASGLHQNRGGSRISRKGVHMFKVWGFALLILSHFS